LAANLEAVQRDKKELEGQNYKLHQRIEELASRALILERRAENATATANAKRMADIKHLNDKWRKVGEKQKQAFFRIRDRARLMKTERDKYAKMYELTQEQGEQYKRMLSQKDSEIKQLREELSKLQTDTNQLQVERSKLQEEVVQDTKAVEDRERQLAEMRSELEKMTLAEEIKQNMSVHIDFPGAVPYNGQQVQAVVQGDFVCSFQWSRSFAGNKFVPIDEATSAQYLLCADDIGAVVRVESTVDESGATANAEIGPVRINAKAMAIVAQHLEKADTKFAVTPFPKPLDTPGKKAKQKYIMLTKDKVKLKEGDKTKYKAVYSEHSVITLDVQDSCKLSLMMDAKKLSFTYTVEKPFDRDVLALTMRAHIGHQTLTPESQIEHAIRVCNVALHRAAAMSDSTSRSATHSRAPSTQVPSTMSRSNTSTPVSSTRGLGTNGSSHAADSKKAPSEPAIDEDGFIVREDENRGFDNVEVDDGGVDWSSDDDDGTVKKIRVKIKQKDEAAGPVSADRLRSAFAVPSPRSLGARARARKNTNTGSRRRAHTHAGHTHKKRSSKKQSPEATLAPPQPDAPAESVESIRAAALADMKRAPASPGRLSPRPPAPPTTSSPRVPSGPVRAFIVEALQVRMSGGVVSDYVIQGIVSLRASPQLTEPSMVTFQLTNMNHIASITPNPEVTSSPSAGTYVSRISPGSKDIHVLKYQVSPNATKPNEQVPLFFVVDWQSVNDRTTVNIDYKMAKGITTPIVGFKVEATVSPDGSVTSCESKDANCLHKGSKLMWNIGQVSPSSPNRDGRLSATLAVNQASQPTPVRVAFTMPNVNAVPSGIRLTSAESSDPNCIVLSEASYMIRAGNKFTAQ
jgi:Muniscin C-terminal mu homology domain